MKAVVSALGLGGFGLALLAGAPAALAQPPLEALPQILQLEISQHPAWRAYKDAQAEQNADAAHEASQAEELNSLPTPARLDALAEQMKKQQAAFQREADATRAFYAVLSPEQRRVFDQVTRLPVAPPPGYRPRAPRYNPPISNLPVPPSQALPPPPPRAPMAAPPPPAPPSPVLPPPQTP